MATVLVVEDEFGIAELFDSILTDEGYHVVTALNGKHGLEMLARERAELIFSDYMMPVMDGAALLSAVLGDPAYRDIPVVMMSSLPEDTVRKRCQGYAAFLRKPFRVVQLVELVNRLTGKDGQRD